MDPNSQSVDSPLGKDIDEHLFNTDLLLHEADRRLAARLYPGIFPVLHFPRLNQAFFEIDEESSKAKKRSRRWGVLAISLCTVGLLGAALTPLGQGQHKPWLVTLSILGAIFSLAGMIIGFMGVFLSKSKRIWLYRRMMTERLRQFHFQTIIREWAQVVAACEADNPEARDAFLAQRNLELDVLLAGFKGNADARFMALVSDDTDMLCWIKENVNPSDEAVNSPIENVLFRAYRKLRIQHQIDYCNHKLHKGGFLFRQTLREQAKSFAGVGLLLIFLVLGLHVAEAVVGVVQLRTKETETGQEAANVGHGVANENPDQADKDKHEGIPVPIILSVISMWIAIMALALHTLADGLRVHAELDRYWEYRASLTHLARRFDAAPSAGERLQVMEELEQISFDEMRGFLHAHDSARFLI